MGVFADFNRDRSGIVLRDDSGAAIQLSIQQARELMRWLQEELPERDTEISPAVKEPAFAEHETAQYPAIRLNTEESTAIRLRCSLENCGRIALPEETCAICHKHYCSTHLTRYERMRNGAPSMVLLCTRCLAYEMLGQF